MALRWVCTIAVACILLIWVNNSMRPPLERSYVVATYAWVDTSGQASLKDVSSVKDWSAAQGWSSFGFGPEPVWVRLHLQAAEPGDTGPWVVQVRPAFLDELTLYDPDVNLELQSGTALQPSEDDALASLKFSFQIPALAHERDIYVRLRSTSARVLSVDVAPLRQAQRQDRLQEWLFGFMVSVSAVFAMWAFGHWLQFRDKVIGVFAVKQTVSTVWAFFVLGYARVLIGPWLPPGVLTVLLSSTVPLLIGATVWFMTALAEGYRPSPMWLRVSLVFAAACALLPLMHAWGLTREMRMISNSLTPVVVMVSLVTLLTAYGSPSRQPIPLGFLAIYIVLYGVVNALPSMFFLHLVPPSTFAQAGNLSQLVLDGMVIFVLLRIRSSAMRREQRQIALDLMRSQEQAKAEARQREDQSQLFAMLAHEIKTPLATLRMWMEADALQRDTLESVISDMNQVIERCVHTGQLSEQALRPAVREVDVVQLTRQRINACRAPGRVQWSLPDGAVLLQTDEQMLSIILDNLLDNACKYSAAQSKVQIRLARAAVGSAGWQWQVENEPGLAGLPDVEHLFEKYYRKPHARRQSGSGLGLFLIRAITGLLHGTVQYEERDNNAVFTVWLPEDVT